MAAGGAPPGTNPGEVTGLTVPGNTGDQAIIRTIKDDLDGWNLRRMVWVADRGFASAANRAYLTRGGGHYIHAEKLRNTIVLNGDAADEELDRKSVV